MKEKDIKIITLSDEKLQILSPPTSINQYNKNEPQSTNKSLNNNKSNQNKAGFTYLSKVEYLGSGGFSKVYKYRGDLENKAVNQNTTKNIFYILMEQCDGNIEKYMKDRGYPLNINEIIILLSQLNDAFYLLDVNNIIHRDIKPSNILYKENKEINPHNKRMNKKIFEGKQFTFKLGDYGICIPLNNKEFSKSQFMGTLDYMAPEIYEMKCEKEHPVYTICWLLGFFEKANALTQNYVNDLKKNCKLFSGNHKEKLLADLIFNHLLIFDPNKRDGWEEYLNHPLFEEYGIINNLKENANYTDGNSQRIKKRVIKRNNLELNKKTKLFNSEKKLDISNKLNLNLELIKEQNNKINLNKNNISIYKYKINTNTERPFTNSISIKTNNILHKNTVMKNLRYMNDKNNKINSTETNKLNGIDINTKIEKKKTFDYINIDKRKNQINNININALSVKNLYDINSHFIAIRSKYKNISQNKDKYNANKILNKNIEINNKNDIKKIIKQSSSFVKEKKNKEETKANSKDKYSKSHKKYIYLKTNIGFIEKKNTLMKSARNDKENNNIRLTTVNNYTFNIKKPPSIKVINYRVEENKKNKNVGFYFSKYSNATNKSKNKDASKN